MKKLLIGIVALVCIAAVAALVMTGKVGDVMAWGKPPAETQKEGAPVSNFVPVGNTVINNDFTLKDNEVIRQSFGIKEQLQISFNCAKGVLFKMYDDNGNSKLSTGDHPQTGWVRKTWTAADNYNFEFTAAEGETDCTFIVSIIGRLNTGGE